MQFDEPPWFPGASGPAPEGRTDDEGDQPAVGGANAARGSVAGLDLGTTTAPGAPSTGSRGAWGLGRGARAFDGPVEDESPFGADVESIATTLGILRRLGGRRAAARSAELPMRDYALAEVVDLVASRGHSSAGEVAATLGLAQSRASVLVRRAREAHWLDAEPGPWDARVTVVSVTDEGRALVELMQADRCATVDRATVLWSDEDRAALARLLGRFADAVERPFRL